MTIKIIDKLTYNDLKHLNASDIVSMPQYLSFFLVLKVTDEFGYLVLMFLDCHSGTINKQIYHNPALCKK
jgi:hypothetical protein